jgi:hypothetical protein
MVWRETTRAGVLAHIIEPQACPLLKEDAEQATSPGEFAYPPTLLLRDSREHELLNPAVYADDAHRGVARLHQRSSHLHELLQYGFE